MQITEKEVQSGLNFRFGLKHLSANMLSSNPIICGKCIKLHSSAYVSKFSN